MGFFRAIRGPLWLALCIAGVALLLTCEVGPRENGDSDTAHTVDDDSADPPAMGVAPGGVSFDVGSVIHQIQFAFRWAEDAYQGGGAMYSARVTTTGRLSFFSGHDVDRPLELQTVAVLRDGWSASESAHDAIAGDGRLLIHRGRVTEWLANQPTGVQQGWSFLARPDGEGDLIVRVSASGQDLVAVTETGIHFADEPSGLGTRYGRATWIDAAGTETDIAPTWIGGVIELRMPADVVDATVFPAVLDPMIEPEFPIDNPMYPPADEGQSGASIAFNGELYLVVWNDRRDFAVLGFDVYGARVSVQGRVLDPNGIPIVAANNTQFMPAVASDGQDFLVAWQDPRNGSQDILARRVLADGTPLDPEPIQVFVGGGSQTNPSVTFGDENYLVVWDDDRSLYHDIYANRITPTGQQLDGNGFVISNSGGLQRRPRAAFDGDNFLVVWQDNRNAVTTGEDIYAARVSPDTTVLDPGGIRVSNNPADQTTPSVSYGGMNFFVVWNDTRDDSGDVFGARVSSSGSVLDSAGIPISQATGDQNNPAVAFGGGAYLVTWTDRRGADQDIYAARVAGSGTVLDPNGFVVCDFVAEQSYPAMVFDGEKFLVGWQDYRDAVNSDTNIVGAFIDSETAVWPRDGVVISASRPANLEEQAAVAFGAANYLVVWRDLRYGSSVDLWGARVTSEGEVLDPMGLPINTSAGEQQNPDVAFGDSVFLVTWEDQRSGDYDIYAARVTIAGEIVDDGGLVVFGGAGDQRDPSVAFADGVFLVVWKDRAGVDLDIRAARVDEDGVVLDPGGIDVSVASGSQEASAVAAGAGQFMAVWHDYRTGGHDIYAARVATDGTVLDTDGLIVCDADGVQISPTITYDDNNFFVAWEDLRDIQADIYAARIDADGHVLDPNGFPLISEAAGQESPAVSFTGFFTLAMWVDFRAGRPNIYGTWIDDEGAVLFPEGVAIDGGDAGTLDPAVASDGDGYSLVVYRGSDEDAVGRMRARRVWLLPVGQPCTQDAECLGEHCVDGVCCNSRCGRGDDGDCQVCDAAGGASADGICTWLGAEVECRPGAGPCDFSETCTGTGPACPEDLFEADTTLCRDSAGPCDAAEYCTGSTAQCPTDWFEGQNHVCREAVAACDAPEYCTGTEVECPADRIAEAGTICRAVVGACDIAETCDGASLTCPPDDHLRSGTECRPVAGICDTSELCEGGTPFCPTDEFKSAGTPCRLAAHDCDAVEYCAGGVANCPADRGQPDETPCADGVFCNGADRCLASACVDHLGDPCHDNLYCNGEEQCDEQNDRCIVENVLECPDDGLWCNGDETCNEETDTCAHTLTPGTRCPDNGVYCDGAEICDEQYDQCTQSGDPCEDDGLFCNGNVTCDEENSACVTVPPPCQPGEICLEAIDECVRPEQPDDFDFDPDVGCGCL